MIELTGTMAKFVEEGAGPRDIPIMSQDITGANVGFVSSCGMMERKQRVAVRGCLGIFPCLGWGGGWHGPWKPWRCWLWRRVVI